MAKMKGLFKRTVVRGLSHPAVCQVFSPLTRARATIFMLHRFADPERGVAGHSPGELAGILDYLRRHGYRFASLAEVVASLTGTGTVLDKAVVFTADDGFYDQATVGVPVFTHYDCPVTIFLITGFLDGQLWPWDDRVAYVMRRTRRAAVTLGPGFEDWQYPLGDARSVSIAIESFQKRCKQIPEGAASTALSRLAEAADVELPTTPPEGYEPMTWGQARELEKAGVVSFGPHSVSHNILAHMTEDRARDEITASWKRVREELLQPVPVFCYPSGIYSERETILAREAGLTAGVTSDPGYVQLNGATRKAAYRFRIKRFAFPDNLVDAIQYCSWIERAKEIVRGTSA